MHPSSITISEFDYELPDERIARYPLDQRDASKLLIRREGKITEDVFRNIASYLPAESVLVFNDTRVVRARLTFTENRGNLIEIFCLEPADQDSTVSAGMLQRNNVRWRCLIGNLRKWKEGELVSESAGITLTASLYKREESTHVVEFSWQPQELSFHEVLSKHGSVPIPPYLGREEEMIDETRYQTVYAAREGSVAAPTAGLHFTAKVFEDLKQKEITSLQVTLHVGAGTFKPVKSDDLGGHDMHSEWMEVERNAIMKLMGASHVTAVGTTSLRTIESLYWMGVKAVEHPEAMLSDLEVKQWDPYIKREFLPDKKKALGALLEWMDHNELLMIICRTSVLIAPPYELKVSDGLITNFHQSRSTLLLLVSAVLNGKWKEVYDYALKNGFRFLSYGDSSLLLK
jgi:S-adenosylmethionine:tRNA ribosyltransferase-isomerase